MFSPFFKALLRGSTRRTYRRSPMTSSMSELTELLETRTVPAVIGAFNAGTGVLIVNGDVLDNTITISRDAAGKILVNGGAVQIQGGTATVANTVQIQVFGSNGNDTITLDEANGALPNASLFGGAGYDTLVGGSGNDFLFGEAGDDTLLGKGGFDFLFGGAGNDTLTGGDADDQVFGESGNDRMIWNPGDDTDLNEGGDGTDTVEVNGGNGTEVFTVTANGTRVRFDRLTPAPFSIDIGTSEKLTLNANGGDDSFSATGNLAALIAITVDGGTGNDTLLGSNGNDTLRGGDGDDFVDGQQGNDTILMGAGNDVMQWDPGDGSDIVEGQDGFDTMLFNGSAGNEIFDVSAAGARVHLTRNLGTILMDFNDVESLHLQAFGGTDSVTVNNLTGTDLVDVQIDLRSSSATLDLNADTVIVNGTNFNDLIDIVGAGNSYSVLGLSAQVSVQGSEGDLDSLIVNGLGGGESINASTLPAGIVKLTIDGGTGNDTIFGSVGADTIIGGFGNDIVDGQQGNDLIQLGDGNDIVTWNPGDANDTIEGGLGVDKLILNGSNATENMGVFANGGRVLLTRDVANVTLDMDDMETVNLNMFGGADNVVVGDLSGTDLTTVNVDLAAAGGGTDSAADTVTVNGTQALDQIFAKGLVTGVSVTGLAAKVNIFNQDAALDRLTINGQGGDDVINATQMQVTGMKLTINGGLGNDVMFGGLGDDQINGGDGDDVAFMGAGDDVFFWNPGDDNDIVEGQAGFDRMQFNGANIAEIINIAANGNRVLFTRNVANVVMDLNDTEAIDFNAVGGADLITVGDMSGTDVIEVNINLASTIGGTAGDGQPDTVVVTGTSGDDVAIVAGDSSGVSVFGLAARVNITGSESANDALQVNVLAGDDVIEGSGLAAGAIQLRGDGGAGDDILVGSDGNDVLAGNDGDDVLIGGLGQDVLDGGNGNNVVIQ